MNNYTESLDENGEPRQETAKEQGQNKKSATDGGQEAAGKVSNFDSNKASKGGEVVVTGKEFGEYKDVKELRKKAVQYYADHLQGTSVNNAALGRIDIDENGLVNFTGAGKREMKNSSAKEHKLLLVRHLPTLIENATDIDGKESSEDKHDGEFFYYLHTSAVIDGKDTPVNITLVKRNDGSIQYYNHTLPTEENKKGAVVSTEPESSNEALGTPSIPAPSVTSSIPQGQQEVTQKDSGSQ